MTLRLREKISLRKNRINGLEVTREALGSKIDETLGESIEKYIAQELNEQEKFEALENNCKTLLEKKKITIASLLVTLPS